MWHDNLDSWCWVNGLLDNDGWKCKYILKYFVKIINLRSARADGVYLTIISNENGHLYKQRPGHILAWHHCMQI